MTAWKSGDGRRHLLASGVLDTTTLLAIVKTLGVLGDIATPATLKFDLFHEPASLYNISTREQELWTPSLDKTAKCVRQQSGSREDAHITGISSCTTNANLCASLTWMPQA